MQSLRKDPKGPFCVCVCVCVGGGSVLAKMAQTSFLVKVHESAFMGRAKDFPRNLWSSILFSWVEKIFF